MTPKEFLEQYDPTTEFYYSGDSGIWGTEAATMTAPEWIEFLSECGSWENDDQFTETKFGCALQDANGIIVLQ